MLLRWTAAGVLEAEHKFRRVTGHTAMPKLVAALGAHDPCSAVPVKDLTMPKSPLN
jgi:hypothetical protein